MTLIKELIEIPEQIQRGDFVLKLVDGVEHAQETLSQYVVTDQLRTCFDDALAFVKSAVTSGQSKAAYLHGSFGSGKSHFMAVLHLLLEHRPEARAVKALAPLVAKHDDWTQGKRFLLVPYHMIGAHSMEAAILGGYVERVRRLHPDAPLPAVYLAGHLFDNARDMREQIGDEAFFKALNRASSGDWGALDAAWDATTFEEALVAPPGDDRRLRLVSDLVGGVFTAFRQVAKSGGEAYVGLDEGLSIISRHAQSLGYHGVILFLDELILWLASHVADLPFVNREMEKLAKLVEAQSSDRPIPLISFVARQRDLRELVGDHVPGAEKLGFLDGLKWSDGRFHVVKLEDRNLPKIAGQRILRPRTDAARIQIDGAFRETLKARSDVIETLLTSGADQAMFREVYPFTPA
ncbi:MAG: hypothetical protein KC492_22560, partial [Myxococcales bacterium]|nr:hypothetical protein [Myxococcales bacterium]